jgi:hypothetical protein
MNGHRAAGLHAELRAKAEREEVSLNSLVLALLAGSVGWTLDSGEASATADLTTDPPQPSTESSRP